MSHAKQLIVVLGAHRSGTSLCAAAIEALGADACLGEHYANEENRKGFFEHPDIVDFNDRLLAELGGSWDNPLFEGSQALEHPGMEAWSKEAGLLFDRIFGAVECAVVKDPRFCQLFAFWREVFTHAGYADDQIAVVHMLREPVEVAVSQRRRAESNPVFYEYGRELEEGAALWLSLTAQALEQSRGLRQLYLGYSDLLHRPAELLGRIGAFLGLDAESPGARAFVDEFVDRSLYRSAAGESARLQLASALPQAQAMYGLLQPLLQGPDTAAIKDGIAVYRSDACREAVAAVVAPALSRLSIRSRAESLDLQRSGEMLADLRRQIDELESDARQVRREHRAVLEPLREQLAQLESGNTALESQLAEQAAELVRVSDESRDTIDGLLEKQGHFEEDIRYQSEVIERMETSFSWRITRPLRGLSAKVHAFRVWRAQRWSRFRLQSILVYHRMSVSRPAVAYWLRRLLRPFFRLLSRSMSGDASTLFDAASASLLSPMRYQQYEATDTYAPLVSVIVPNYNHAAYLRLRLDSIFSQSYSNFEVILLDDASRDGSAEILREYHRRYPDKSTLLVNEENSGGVFHQWDRGLSLARGDIVWIAESDDWCTENFLEKLVPFFENEAVQIAYARTVFMDGEGTRQIWSIHEYLHDIDPRRWNQQILATGPEIVREAFAVKNIIPNVSSALMRTPRQLEILADPVWRSMRTCGDWVLYLHLLRGGMLAYTPEASNYYRLHGQNTSVSSYVEDEFYREHEVVARTVRALYDVPAAQLERLRDNLEVHWRETRGDYSDAALAQCFSVERVMKKCPERTPNLLIASYAFCAGGGETFPVSLANIMKDAGYNVTYLDCAREPRVEGVRRRLRADIPVVSDFTQLERVLQDFEIDLIHSHHAWVDSTILELLSPESPCRVVVTSHGMYETINEYDLRYILPRLVERTAAIIYVAEKNLEAIRSHGLLGRANVERIDNALEVEAFPVLDRTAMGIAEDAFVLSLISRAMEEKGWQEAIDAVGMAREHSERDIRLLLVGDGAEFDRLSAAQLPDYVHLEGFQENVRGYFAVADMGLLPSRFRGESFPLVIIECLQTDTPFIASDLGEISRMLTGECGIAGAVVPLNRDEIDIPALAATIGRFADDSEALAAARRAVPSAAAKFDPAVLARRHDEVYRAALRPQQAPAQPAGLRTAIGE